MKKALILLAWILAGAGGFSQSADLGLQVSGPLYSPMVGSTLTLTVSVTNRGPDSASDVVVANLLPESVLFVSATSSQGTCFTNAAGLLCDLGVLTNGSRATVSLVIRPTIPGLLTNTAVVTAQESDPNPLDNSATNVITVRPPYVSITAPKQILEGNTGTNDAIFTVRLNTASGLAASVDYEAMATNRDTATPWVDFIPVSGTLVFPPGTTNATIAVPIIGDLLSEANETFEVRLSNLTNVSLNQDRGIAFATITDDDPLPSVSVGDVSLLEGDTGLTQAVFAVTLSTPSGQQTSVRCTTLDGTAVAPIDYVATNLTLIFPAGTTTQYVAVLVRGNTVHEPDESFYLQLSSPLGLTLGSAKGTGLILDDDAVPGRLDHFAWAAVPPAQIAGVGFTATVTALDAFNQVVTDFNGSVPLLALAAAGGTTLPVEPAILSNFVAGVWSGTVAVQQTNPTVLLRADDGLEHLGSSAYFAVVPLPVLSLQLPAEATEGNGVVTGLVSIATGLPRTDDLSIDLAISNPNRATANPVVIIPAGSTNALFNLNIVDDALLNGSQPVTVTASASNSVPAGATVVVHDNESTTLSFVLSASVMENSGTITGLLQAAQAPAVDVSVMLISSDTNQVQAPAATVLPAGASEVAFPITVVDNRMIDGTRQVTLTGAVRNWTPAQSTLTILDDESTNLVLELPATAIEGQGLLASAGRVSLGGTLSNALTVALASSDTNSLVVPASVFIPAGATSVTFNVTVPDNTLRNGTRAVEVSAQAAGFGGVTNLVQVLDNDPAKIVIDPVPSPQTSGVPFQVHIRLFDANGQPLTGFQTNTVLRAWAGGDLPITPASAGPFTNGEWTGMVTITGVQQQVFLIVMTPDYNEFGTLFLLKAPPVQVLSVPRVRDLTYNPYNGMFYVSVKGNYAFISSIATLDPQTGWLQHWKEPYYYPDRIAITPDGQTLYVTFPWDGGYETLPMSNGFACLGSFGSSWMGTFSVQWGATDFELLNQPGLMVATRYLFYDGGGWTVSGAAGAAVYKNTWPLPDTFYPPYASPMYLTASPDGQTVYATWPGGYAQLAVTTNGLSPVQVLTSDIGCPAFASGYGNDFVYDAGLLYRDNGEVVDPARIELIARLPGHGLVRPESGINRVFLLGRDSPGAPWRLQAFDEATYAPLGSTNLTELSGTPTRPVRAGTNVLAFCTSSEQVFLLHGILQPTEYATDLATSFELLSTTITQSNTTAFALTVTNQGPNPTTDLLLSARLPAALGPITAASLDGVCSATNGLVLCSIPSLAPGATARLSFQVPTLVAGTFPCSASVASPALEPNYTNNISRLTLTVPPLSPPILQFTAIDRGTNNVLIRFPTLGGARYRLERSATLAPDSWTVAQDFLYGTGETLEINAPNSPEAAACFYRVVLVP